MAGSRRGSFPPQAWSRHRWVPTAGVPEPLLPLIASGLEKDPEDWPGLDAFLERCSALAEGGTLRCRSPSAR
jgi:hypothetical protein